MVIVCKYFVRQRTAKAWPKQQQFVMNEPALRILYWSTPSPKFISNSKIFYVTAEITARSKLQHISPNFLY
jgi:hypothetical protein